MHQLFETSTVNGMTLANRFVRSATWEGMANDDYISMCRPFIREPHLINRWKSGDTRKAACLSDNLCFRPAIKGQGLYCVVEEQLRSKGDVKQPGQGSSRCSNLCLAPKHLEPGRMNQIWGKCPYFPERKTVLTKTWR